MKKIYFIIFLSFFIMFINCAKCEATDIPKVYFEGDISNMTDKKDERNILLKYKSKDLDVFIKQLDRYLLNDTSIN